MRTGSPPSRWALTVLGAALLCAGVFPGLATAAAGDPDPTFGSAGFTITNLGGADVANSVGIQSDGKIVVAGYQTTPNNAIVARYSADGIIDDGGDGPGGAGFGPTGDGFIVLNWGGASDQAYAMAVQSDDKIVIAGGSGGNFALARLNANGTLDDGGDGPTGAGFGGDGKLTTDFGSGDFAGAVAIDSSGRIVAAGTTGTFPADDFAVARYSGVDGSLDDGGDGPAGAGFDGDGKLTTDLGGPENGASVAIQGDGKILVGGAGGASPRDFAIARYNPLDGSLDDGGDGAGPLGFDLDGKLTTDFGGGENLYQLAIQGDGKLVAAGNTDSGGGDDFALARYNLLDGSPDTGFDGDGKQTTDFGGSEVAYGVAVQSDGFINAVGYTQGFTPDDDAAVAHYTPVGVLDPTFSGDGKATYDIGSSVSNYGNAVAMRAGKKILLVGDGGGDVQLARVFGDTDMDNDGIVDSGDNCPSAANANQANTDGDGLGDACDPDDDNDSVADGSDGCPVGAAAGTDTDGDGCKDAGEDSDDDNDAVADGTDNCTLVANADQANNDGDAQGDVCDADDDNDTAADTSDNCSLVANAAQTNTDGDAQGDACDPDDDNDGVADGADACPLVAGAASNGCAVPPGPTTSARTLTLSHADKSEKFKGSLSADVAACAQDQRVKVFHKVKGPDKSIGTATTKSTGKYSLTKEAPDGKYYATAAQSTAAGVTCLTAKSGKVKLG